MATVTEPKIILAELPDMDLNEGPHELVRGEIVVMTPSEFWHDYIFWEQLCDRSRLRPRTGLGFAAGHDSRVEISDGTLRGANLAYFHEERWPRERVGEEPPPGPPELAVEVVSPSDPPAKVLGEVMDYLSAGIPMVWVAHPRGRALAICRGDDPTPTVLEDEGIVEYLPEPFDFRCPVANFSS